MHLFVRQLRPRHGATARIADHRGEIADDENRLMPEILELAQFPQDDRVAEMDVGARRIDAELDPQRAIELSFSRSSASLIICATPCVRNVTASSSCMRVMPP